MQNVLPSAMMRKTSSTSVSHIFLWKMITDAGDISFRADFASWKKEKQEMFNY